jgi:hypothetical protein
MELLCMEITVVNGKFEILSRNFSFMPGYTFSQFLQIGSEASLKSEI